MPAEELDGMGIVFGTWLIASPWALGFVNESLPSPMPSSWVLVIGYALWAACIDIAAGETVLGSFAVHVPMPRDRSRRHSS
jgi:hypothetical protein